MRMVGDPVSCFKGKSQHAVTVLWTAEKELQVHLTFEDAAFPF